MATAPLHKRILFGVKVKQLRQQQHLSFSDLSKLSGLSISYLNEIEKGKKYPKSDKIEALAKSLHTTDAYLTSSRLPKRLEPLSELIHSPMLNELPLDLFGIDFSKIVDIIANAPTRVGAFISAMIDISRKYELQQESFYYAALRSYQRLFDNYFEELERQVDTFTRIYRIDTAEPTSVERLSELFQKEFKCKIDRTRLPEHQELRRLRSVFIPKKRTLLINSELTSTQEAFLLGKEIGFQYLKLKDRVYTSSLLKLKSFDEVLNNFQASYFSVALLLNQDELAKDLRRFFNRPIWDGRAFLEIMEKYNASPEMFLQRLTNILPRIFGMQQLFFLRFNNNIGGSERYVLSKELHLSRQHQPYGNETKQHYCRRWVALRALEDLHALQQQGENRSAIAAVQRSQYHDSDADYLCFTIARPAHPTPNTNVSVTIGLGVTPALKRTIKFWNASNIPVRQVNQVCEYCPIMDCKERAAEPVNIQRAARIQNMLDRVDELMID